MDRRVVKNNSPVFLRFRLGCSARRGLSINDYVLLNRCAVSFSETGGSERNQRNLADRWSVIRAYGKSQIYAMSRYERSANIMLFCGECEVASHVNRIWESPPNRVESLR